jgi:enoyl-CoA hydratase/carnithine racemase
MSNFETLIYEKQERIAYITLNRPEALNAYNLQMRDDLYEILRALKDDDEVRVAILRGAGEKAFFAGADLSEFLTAPSPTVARQARFERDVWGLFLSISQPLIAVLHGYVLGSGIEMALCCDIRITSDDARFGLPEVALGIIPAAGGTQTLPRIVGRGKALEMLLTNRWLDAEEAFQFNLVNQVLPQDKVLPAAVEMAEEIASYDPMAVQAAKQAVIRGLDLSLSEGIYLEKTISSQLRGTSGQPNGREN